ncbi:MAG TPA: DNA-directed RNA polymerase subunit omega [Candidatus Pseudogracilibacillus intestinigallinarum]|uniref:DNA-directed RNA polymerase subunit omega n=1 Tax=Candidatus Pseudogracilibacillus intestinigallinarum TaxID=2838742 RepID=A0A9D1TJE0_9BACI|nr:DNA-directed RNA polymerase subunit omega [Candidatus Pseudogracilibacillus intestinigallinarum]
MLEPSIDNLLKKIDSKYTLVTISSRRARELQDEENTQIENPTSIKPVGIALEEIQEEKLVLKEEA